MTVTFHVVMHGGLIIHLMESIHNGNRPYIIKENIYMSYKFTNKNNI